MSVLLKTSHADPASEALSHNIFALTGATGDAAFPPRLLRRAQEIPSPSTSRFHADRIAGGDRHHRGADRPAAARRAEGARGGGPHRSAPTTSSRSAWPRTTTTTPTSSSSPPGSATTPSTRTAGPSWAVLLLPYLEQDNVYQQWDLRLPRLDAAAGRVPAAVEVLPLPGRPAFVLSNGDFVPAGGGLGDYAACFGTDASGSTSPTAPSSRSPTWPTARPPTRAATRSVLSWRGQVNLVEHHRRHAQHADVRREARPAQLAARQERGPQRLRRPEQLHPPHGRASGPTATAPAAPGGRPERRAGQQQLRRPARRRLPVRLLRRQRPAGAASRPICSTLTYLITRNDGQVVSLDF